MDFDEAIQLALRLPETNGREMDLDRLAMTLAAAVQLLTSSTSAS